MNGVGSIVYFWMTKTLSECRCDRRSLSKKYDTGGSWLSNARITQAQSVEDHCVLLMMKTLSDVRGDTDVMCRQPRRRYDTGGGWPSRGWVTSCHPQVCMRFEDEGCMTLRADYC